MSPSILRAHLVPNTAPLVGLLIVAFGILLEPDHAADYFRAVALGLGTYVLILSALILYSRRLSAQSNLVVISHMITVVSAHVFIIDRLGGPFVWYGTPIVLIADLIGALSLSYVYRYGNRPANGFVDPSGGMA